MKSVAHRAVIPAHRPTRWGVVVTALLTGAVAAAQLGKVPPALPELRLELGIGMILAGWITSIFTVISAAAAIVVGIFADRTGYRRFITAGLACLAAGSLLGGSATTGSGLLAARTFEGLGFVAVIIGAPALIVQATEQRHHRLALGLWATYFPVGVGTMIAISALVLGTLGWRGLWYANAVLLVAFIAVFAGLTRSRDSWPVPAPSRNSSWREVRAAIARPGPWLLAGSFLIAALVMFTIMAWLPTFLIETQGRSTKSAALLSALVTLSFAPGGALGGWLLHQNIPRWVVLGGGSVMIGVLSFVVFSVALPAGATIGVAMLLGVTGGTVPGAIFSGVPLHAPTPDQAGAVTGVIMQGTNVGMLAGPPALAAVVVATGGWHHAGWLLLAFALAGCGLALMVRRVEKRLEGALAGACSRPRR